MLGKRDTEFPEKAAERLFAALRAAREQTGGGRFIQLSWLR
jgi:hypothetical protein